MMRLGRIGRSIIYKRVKSGKGYKGKLAALQPSTVEVRKGNGIMRTFKGKGGKRVAFIPGVDGRPAKTGEFFSPKRSNLTFSGQLLDSIDMTSLGNRGFTLFIPNTRRNPYKNDDVYNKTAPPTNQELAVFLQSGRTSPTYMQARPFFQLTKGEIRIIIREYNNIIKKIIRKRGF